MRAIEFLKENRLDEIVMSPASLSQEAARINAVAGVEFEMVVPGVGDDPDGDMEPDMDADIRVYDINDIMNFFDDGEFNSGRDIRNAHDSLTEEYKEWALDQLSEAWSEDGREFFNDYTGDEFNEKEAREEIIEELKDEYDDLYDDFDDDQIETMVSKRMGNKKDTWLEEEWDFGGYLYDNAREAFEEDRGLPDERDFLKSELDINHASDFPYTQYGLTWPYYTSPQSGEAGISDVADEFGSYMGRPVKYSSSYHGATRDKTHYIVEPDSSIDGDGEGGGLEFVSPPLPLPEMLSDMKKVIEWARTMNCTTNQSTGLHMNVSIPDFNSEQLDYVKLALLLGDEHVLQSFGRESNTYTKSALQKVKQAALTSPEMIGSLLTDMRTGLSATASKLIQGSSVAKYTSINPKTGYVEFRSPGGDWLNIDFDKLAATLNRFVVALDAACDPNKYKTEYLKKLYKLLSPSPEDKDAVALFAKYSTGLLNRKELKDKIRIMRAAREGKLKKWVVYVPDEITGQPLYILGRFDATDEQQAIELLRKREGPAVADRELQAKPETEYQQG